MLKAFDGFDHYNVAADLQAKAGFLQYGVPSTNNALTWVTGADGLGKAARFTTANNTRCMTAIFGARNPSAFLGLKLKLSYGAELRFRDAFAGTTQCSVLLDPTTRAIAIYRGESTSGTLLYLSDPAAWAFNTWFMFEANPVISNTVGAVAVRIDGVAKAGVVGVDTQQSNRVYWDAVQIIAQHGSAGNSTVDVDNLYYCDPTTGPGPYPMNTFIGISRAVTLFPNGNDAVAFTPLSGTNYEMVDETEMDSDTTYNYSPTYLAADSFNFAALPVSVASIFGVQVTMAARKDGTDPVRVQQFISTAGTEIDASDDLTLSETYQYYSSLWEFDAYNGLAWSVAAVNALSAGYRNNTAVGYGMAYGVFYG